MPVKNKLAIIPSIDLLLSQEETQILEERYSRSIIKEQMHTIIAALKQKILSNEISMENREQLLKFVLLETKKTLEHTFSPSLKPVINATGIILHTGLGRAPFSETAQENIIKIMRGYSNIELDLVSGKRGERNDHVSYLLSKLTGAESALVTNNNAAAVFIALNTLSFGKEAIISRGQLIEIGGSFRIPDVMKKSGAIMREIGTTNKTKLSDYENAINDNTGVIVVAHTSNYRVLGFTQEVELEKVVKLAHNHNIPVLHDLGGGVIVDLQQYGLPYEPLVKDSINAGADVVTFSGDKILGGPQAGILLGKTEWLQHIHANPIMRAVRCDKLIFAALEATLKLFFQHKNLVKNHKTLQMLTESPQKIKEKAEKLQNAISSDVHEYFNVSIEKSAAQTGSGALPLEKISSYAVTISPTAKGIEDIAFFLRQNNPPVIGYIKNEKLYLDMRTVEEEQVEQIAKAIIVCAKT